MLEVDRLMVDVFGIRLMQMMEHAGRSIARIARARFLDGDLGGKRVVVLVGTGGNGGGGLVAARHLANGGANVEVWTTRADDAYEGVPAHQLRILRRMQVPVNAMGDPPAEPDLVVDALLGYSLAGAPRGRHADLVRWANEQAAPVLSLDLPTGVDATTGEAYDPHVRAAATVTLALPKTGLAQSREAVGDVYLADISVPPSLYAQMELPAAPLFGAADLLLLTLTNSGYVGHPFTA
jgi:NAD(P)H-hydrate epimerase